jgi:benzylsuccinate CoA-transferase BbsF subunit
MSGAKALPLAGVKVADFCWAIAGPTTTKYLAIYGAQVVKIETHSRPDSTRISPPFAGKPNRNSSLHFGILAPSKLSVSLNLKDPRAQEVAKRLIAWADVVTENFSVGQMGEWGLDYDSVRKINPKAIMLSSSQQGQTGPHAGHPGLGGMLQALTGFNHFTGWPDREPLGPALPLPDMIAPWFSIIAIIAALEQRARTGTGQYIDLSQLEAGLQFLAPGLLAFTVNGREGERRGNFANHAAPHNAYRCQGDDRWCAVSVRSDAEWQALCDAIGKPELAKDDRFDTMAKRMQHSIALDAIITGWTAPRDARQVMETLQSAGVPAGVVATGRDLHEDPQLRHRRHFIEVEHQRIGRYPVDAPAFRVSRMEPDVRPAPLLGEHNDYVMRELLKMPEGEYQELVNAGVFS